MAYMSCFVHTFQTTGQPLPPSCAHNIRMSKAVLTYTCKGHRFTHNIFNFMKNSKYKEIILHHFHWSLDEWDVSLPGTCRLKNKLIF